MSENKHAQKVSAYFFVILIFFVVLAFSAPPQGDVYDKSIVIQEGLSARQVGELLGEQNIVYSPLLFRLAVILQRGSYAIHAGNYLFEKPLGVWAISRRVIKGDFGFSQIRIRIPEGLTRIQMADIFSDALVVFDTEDFLRGTERKEGYLFPDTYFFFQDATADDVVKRLEETFTEKTENIRRSVSARPYSFYELVIMASIVEREAYDPIDQRLIAGVLWNRIEYGIPLQTDATLYYLLGKPSSELTLEDLDTDSLYNTYEYNGLPPGPISNPGLSALEAALNPTESDYFYYLSDADGITYFAETFEGHKANKELYLR